MFKGALGRVSNVIRNNRFLYMLIGLPRAVGQVIANRSLRTIIFAPPGHYYSPLPNLRSYVPSKTLPDEIAGISMRETSQVELAEKLAGHTSGAPYHDPGLAIHQRYQLSNSMFGPTDAYVLYGMLKELAPASVLEVGSGYSSAVMLDYQQHENPNLELTLVEPYPSRLMNLMHATDSPLLLGTPLQGVPSHRFETLDENDILFVDSSHVLKVGSDVHLLLFEVLPLLRPGVVIHFHDVFWPFEYPEEWILAGRAWNEAYALRAFLMHNRNYEVLFFNSYMWVRHQKAIAPITQGTGIDGGGSLWIQKVS